jgi:DNA-binding CsgD family transcriptional regulator
VSGLLPARQVDVLRLVANGASNADAARRLRISERTVEQHLARAGAALGTSGRAHTVAVAWRVGVLTDADVTVPEALRGRLRPREDPEAPMPHPGGAEPADAHAAPQEASL